MKKLNLEVGKLYLVGTPIGNLDDISFRAVETLKLVDEIYCEDTRRTALLMRHYRIDKKMLQSFHDHSPRSALIKIKNKLMEGKNLAYVTDGGMPSISDPGFVLVRMCHENGIPLTIIPGASAATMLFTASALPSPKFLFHGFFPRTKGEVEKILELIRTQNMVHLFYEAPSRILSTMEVFSRNSPEAQVVLGREMTKAYEEFLTGTALELYEQLKNQEERIRGEFSIAILDSSINKKNFHKQEKFSTNTPSQLNETDQDKLEQHILTSEQQAEIASLIKSGMTSKDASKLLSKKYGVSRKIIYDFIISHLT